MSLIVVEWKIFQIRELCEAYAFAGSGGIAIHLMGTITGDRFKNAPRVFRGKEFAHLFGPNLETLISAARSIGCKPEWIQKSEDPKRRHFDLVGAKLQRALKRARHES